MTCSYNMPDRNPYPACLKIILVLFLLGIWQS